MKMKLLSLILVILLACLVASPVLAAKSYFAERYDVVISVQPDGVLMVTETIAFRFEGGPFTYVFRELNFTNLDEIDNLQALMDGQVLAQGAQPGQVEIEAGQPIKVTWHFSPASDATHEFTLSYRVQGAIRQEAAADGLTWRAIPEEHDYTIAHSLIRIEYPAGITPIDGPNLEGVTGGLETGSQAAVFTIRQIGEDTPVDVTVRFPRGSLVTQPPAWQAEQAQQAQRTAMGTPFGLGAAAITAFLGAAGVFLAGRSFRRQSDTSHTAAQNFSAPPRAIPPALAARLTGSSVPFLGTLFDLARRGLLRIEEGPKRWGSRTFTVIRQPAGERLQPHEQVFLEALFKKTDRVALSEIASLAHNRKFVKMLDQELTLAGWRDAERSRRRGRFLAASVLGMLLGLAAMGAGSFIASFLSESQPAAVVVGALLLGGGVAACGVSFVGLIVAALISTLSDEGAQQASAWNSFAGYLRNITRGREPVTSPDQFERYLPYAAGLGIATEWTKFFQKQADVPIPAWFYSLQSSLDDGSFVAIMAAISAADSSASSAAGVDGGGASGGGSSGAG